MADDRHEQEHGEEERMLSLVSQEGESFSVPISVAKMSELVKTMIDGACPPLLPCVCSLARV